MRTHFNPKNNPRVIIIQKLYGKFYNEDNELEFPKHRFKKFIKDIVIGTIERNELIITELHTKLGNDFVFSVDSILTAIGLTDVLLLMVIAVIASILFMIFYSSKISDIIDRYPSLEILALSFLILIGFTLILEAAHYEVPKGFIYFALFFTLGVELLNIKFRRVSLKRIKIKK